jgi:FKBP-type peptidyl-prolyl cis-trans isomerase FkpA
MKIYVSFFLLTLLSACVKDGKKCTYQTVTASAPGSERTEVLNYLNTKGISATLHPNGFYYKVIKEGTGSKPAPCNIVSIQYTGKLTTDSIFDASPANSFYSDRVGTLLPGLQLGLSIVGAGGNVLLYLPPTLGFGNQPYPNPVNPVIPANSILIYDVTLSSIQ